MELGKPQGIGMASLGTILLTGAILVLVFVPSWGQWIASYPGQVAQTLPPDGAPSAQGILGSAVPELEISQVLEMAEAGQLETIVVTGDKLAVTTVDGNQFKSRREPSVSILELLQSRGVTVGPGTVQVEIKQDGGGFLLLKILGPLLEQIGGYIRIAGYFVGSLLTILSLVLVSVGTMIIRTATRRT